MAIPDYPTLLRPMLEYLSDGSDHANDEIGNALADEFVLSKEERTRRKNKQRVFTNRVAWAKARLRQFGLIESPRPGIYRILQSGTSLLSHVPGPITLIDLNRLKSVGEDEIEVDEQSLTVERIDELLKFLPIFEKQHSRVIAKKVILETPSDFFSSPKYTRSIERFFRLLYKPWWLDEDYGPGGEMVQHDELIQTADLDRVKKMLFWCARGEHWVPGHWAEVVKSGKIRALLRRLAAIRASM